MGPTWVRDPCMALAPFFSCSFLQGRRSRFWGRGEHMARAGELPGPQQTR